MANATTDDALRQIKRMLFMAIGIVLMLAAFAWGISNLRFINMAAAATGTVTKLNAGGSHPEIRFTTNDGRTIEYPQNGLIFGYKVGDEVPVLYDPQNPQQSTVNTFGALWGFPLLGFILGFCFLCVALFLKSKP